MNEIFIDLENDYRADTLKRLFSRARFLILLTLIIAALGAGSLGALYWRYYEHQQEAAEAFPAFVQIMKNKKEALAEQEKAYNIFYKTFRGTSYALLATFWQADAFARHAQRDDTPLEEKILLLKKGAFLLRDQTSLKEKSFFMRARAWDIFHMLALVKGGFLLLQAHVPYGDIEHYLKPLHNEQRAGTFYRQALEIEMLSAYENSHPAQAKKLLSQIEKGADETASGQDDVLNYIVLTMKQILSS